VKTKFLPVKNVQAFNSAMTRLEQRGSGVPGLALVVGPAGRGKTQTSMNYRASGKSYYVTANPLWSALWMLNDVQLALQNVLTGISYGITKRAFEECARRLSDNPMPLIIDEADQICRNMKILETLRHLHDRTGAPIVFIGTEIIAGRLAQFEQFWSRVSQVVTFNPLELAEIRMVAKTLCDLDLNEEAAGELYKKTHGQFRDEIVMLTHLERAAKSNKTSSPAPELVTKLSKRILEKAA
jgi:DNA transposition AAA+ family ATPase